MNSEKLKNSLKILDDESIPVINAAKEGDSYRDKNTGELVYLSKDTANKIDLQRKAAQAIMIAATASTVFMQSLTQHQFDRLIEIAATMTWDDVPRYWRRYAIKSETSGWMDVAVERRRKELWKEEEKKEAEDSFIMPFSNEVDEWLDANLDII